MARVRTRGDRHTGLFTDVDGVERSAGTYDSYDRALEVAKGREEWQRAGTQRVDPVVAATITVRQFEGTFLRFAEIAPVTKRQYRSVLRMHVYPVLGDERFADVHTEGMAWIVDAMKTKGSSASMIRLARDVLSKMMQVGIALGYRTHNPIRGYPVPRRPATRKTIPILTPAQFDRFRSALELPGARMLANTIIGSGIRHGEAWALNVGDLVGNRLDIYKAVAESGEEFSLSKERFDLNGQPKDGWARAVPLQPKLVASLRAYISEMGLGPTDVLFPPALVIPRSGASVPKQRPPLTEERLVQLERELGLYEGRYRHGTKTAYTKGCHCEWCRQCMTEYRNERRRRERLAEQGLPAETPKVVARSGGQPPRFVSRHAWLPVWDRACEAAGIYETADAAGLPRPKPKHLRHTHASWLINAGDLPANVMDRLGHSDLSITTRYVQMLDHSESTIALLDSLIDF